MSSAARKFDRGYVQPIFVYRRGKTRYVWVHAEDPTEKLIILEAEVTCFGRLVEYDYKEICEVDGALTVSLKVSDKAQEDTFQRSNITDLVIPPRVSFTPTMSSLRAASCKPAPDPEKAPSWPPRQQMALEDWKKAVAAPVAELLKKHGFRKKGLRFSADRGDAELLVGLQSSQSSDKTQLVITVNLSITLGQLERDPSTFSGDGHWRKRIGRFMEKPSDYWWTCRNSEDAIRAGKEIVNLLETSALPEMQRLASAEAMTALWASGRSPGLTEGLRKRYLAALGVS